MSTIPLSVLSYNTHLFGDLITWKLADLFKGITYQDDPRCDQLKGSFLDPSPRPADLIALQEVWSSSYANDIKAHGKEHNYPYFFCVDDKRGKFNESGLILLGAVGAEWPSNNTYYSYIKNCNVDGFSGQDYPAGLGKLPPIPYLDEVSGKGYICVQCQLTNAFNSAIPATAPVNLGFFTTHMVTNSSSYPKSAACCFQSIRDAINSFAASNPSAGILLAGDLNIDWDANGGPSTDGFHTYVLPYLEDSDGGAGLTDAYAQVNGNTPGYTIDNTNTLWDHFNPGQTAQQRIDFIFYKNSQNGNVTFAPKSASVLNPAYFSPNADPLQVNSSDVSGLDVSDHYPLFAAFDLSF